MEWVAIGKSRRLSMVGAVYAIRNDDRSVVKIGWSFDPLRRLQQLQTGSVDSLRLVAFIGASKKVEAELHELFADSRIRGEWFDDRDRDVSGLFLELEKQGY
jgi:hypothetical protein